MLDSFFTRMSYKNRGWKNMQMALDEKMPVVKSSSNWKSIGVYALCLALAVAVFSIVRLSSSLYEVKQQNNSLNSSVHQAKMENTILHSLFNTSLNAYQKSKVTYPKYQQTYTGVLSEFGSTTSNFGIGNTDFAVFKDQSFVTTNQSVQPLESLPTKEFERTRFAMLMDPTINVRPESEVNVEPIEFVEQEETKNAIYTLTSVDKSFRFNGIGAGIMTSLPIKDKVNLSIGLGYLWAKNYDAIQASRQADFIQQDGQGNTEIISREFDTKILVDHLHYLQLPISVAYQFHPKFNIGLGLENRFLVNNYHTDGVDPEYNGRYNAYIVNSKNAEPYEYNIRKIAMGFNGSLEYQILKNLSINGHFYSGLLNISGDKVFNNTNNIKNSSYQLGVKYYWGN